MPALPTVNAMYIKKIRDLLRTGPDYRTAQLMLGSGTSQILIQAQDPGPAGNNITVTVTVPGGTSALAVTVSGNAITIALNVSAGVPQAASNTSTLITAAINASAAASALVRAFVPAGAGAGSLSAAVAATNLSGGSMGSGESTVQTYPMNFLRAQDMASVLELLSDALDTGTLTATSGTSTSVSRTGAFVANTQVGNVVTFTGNVTAALAGKSYVVVSNTANALTFGSALAGTPAVGDTFTITGALVDTVISKLRDGHGKADSSTGNLYGDSRLVLDAIVRMTRQLSGTVSDQQIAAGTTGSGSSLTTVVIGSGFKIDAFKNRRFVISGQTRKIVGNTDTSVFFDLPLSAAPASGVSWTINVPMDSADACDQHGYTFASGGQPRNNRIMAEMLRVLENAVVAFTLPT